MKKAVALLTVLFVLASCGNTKKEEAPQTETTTESANAVDTHNAKNSLDYKGTYKGTLPTASGEGMQLTVALTDSTYTRTSIYIGKKAIKPFVETGKYKWNDAGNTITLEGIDAPNSYFVGENTLTHLDMDGKKIEGELAEMYILKK